MYQGCARDLHPSPSDQPSPVFSVVPSNCTKTNTTHFIFYLIILFNNYILSIWGQYKTTKVHNIPVITNNTITLHLLHPYPSFPVVADVLSEFLEVAIHLILYVREVYPTGIFQKRKKYNVPVQVSDVTVFRVDHANIPFKVGQLLIISLYRHLIPNCY